jgi:hypothetical protein
MPFTSGFVITSEARNLLLLAGCPVQASFAWAGICRVSLLSSISKVNYPTLTSRSATLGWGRRPISDSGLSGCDIRSDHIQVVAGGFESLFGIALRNKPSVVIEGQIALPAETIKNSQQTGMFLVDARLHKIDDGDVVPWLASCTESVAEHETQRSFEHCFVGLLKTSFFVKSENLAGRGQLLFRAREEAVDLRPVNGVRF